ncbi:unnamed protein product [Paramecium sonneborni]|uniref:Glutamine amidotransferase domain-containing protein n=1 Tax=Paramecium sonneborni TaxID=65129 RepID=A0A8S1KJP0_9CILI|nr:unnamed protein product [Paramecium sonneborni]
MKALKPWKHPSQIEIAQEQHIMMRRLISLEKKPFMHLDQQIKDFKAHEEIIQNRKKWFLQQYNYSHKNKLKNKGSQIKIKLINAFMKFIQLILLFILFIKIIMEFQKQVTLIIKSENLFIYQSEDLDLFSIKYSPNFDTNDFFAATRLLFQKQQKYDQDLTIELYADLLLTQEFKEILGIVNQGVILKATPQEKVILINFKGNFGFKSEIIPEIVKQYIPKEIKKRYALLITEPLYYTKYVNIMEAMHLGIYKEEDENWEVYLVIEHKFPKLQGLDGIVITGSSSAAYDLSEDWKEPLFQFLREADKCKIRILGICFGHQVLAHCLGGEAQKMMHVDRMQVGRKALSTQFKWNDQLIENLNVYQIHGDFVAQLPKDTEVIMSTDHCQNYAFKNDHILGVQFHPEFNALILLYIFRNSTNQLKDIYMNDCYESFKQGSDHQQIIWEFMINFLKNK